MSESHPKHHSGMIVQTLQALAVLDKMSIKPPGVMKIFLDFVKLVGVIDFAQLIGGSGCLMGSSARGRAATRSIVSPVCCVLAMYTVAVFHDRCKHFKRFLPSSSGKPNLAEKIFNCCYKKYDDDIIWCGLGLIWSVFMLSILMGINQVFRCYDHPIIFAGDVSDGRESLTVPQSIYIYPEILCGSSEHTILKIMSFVSVVIVIGAPVFKISYVIHRAQVELRETQTTTLNLRRYAFLIGRYGIQKMHWIVLTLFRNVGLSYIPVAFGRRPSLQVPLFSCYVIFWGMMVLRFLPWKVKQLSFLESYMLCGIGMVGGWMFAYLAIDGIAFMDKSELDKQMNQDGTIASFLLLAILGLLIIGVLMHFFYEVFIKKVQEGESCQHILDGVKVKARILKSLPLGIGTRYVVEQPEKSRLMLEVERIYAEMETRMRAFYEKLERRLIWNKRDFYADSTEGEQPIIYDAHLYRLFGLENKREKRCNDTRRQALALVESVSSSPQNPSVDEITHSRDLVDRLDIDFQFWEQEFGDDNNYLLIEESPRAVLRSRIGEGSATPTSRKSWGNRVFKIEIDSGAIDTSDVVSSGDGKNNSDLNCMSNAHTDGCFDITIASAPSKRSLLSKMKKHSRKNGDEDGHDPLTSNHLLNGGHQGIEWCAATPRLPRNRELIFVDEGGADAEQGALKKALTSSKQATLSRKTSPSSHRDFFCYRPPCIDMPPNKERSSCFAVCDPSASYDIDHQLYETNNFMQRARNRLVIKMSHNDDDRETPLQVNRSDHWKEMKKHADDLLAREEHAHRLAEEICAKLLGEAADINMLVLSNEEKEKEKHARLLAREICAKLFAKATVALLLAKEEEKHVDIMASTEAVYFENHFPQNIKREYLPRRVTKGSSTAASLSYHEEDLPDSQSTSLPQFTPNARSEIGRNTHDVDRDTSFKNVGNHQLQIDPIERTTLWHSPTRQDIVLFSNPNQQRRQLLWIRNSQTHPEMEKESATASTVASTEFSLETTPLPNLRGVEQTLLRERSTNKSTASSQTVGLDDPLPFRGASHLSKQFCNDFRILQGSSSWLMTSSTSPESWRTPQSAILFSNPNQQRRQLRWLAQTHDITPPYSEVDSMVEEKLKTAVVRLTEVRSQILPSYCDSSQTAWTPEQQEEANVSLIARYKRDEGGNKATEALSEASSSSSQRAGGPIFLPSSRRATMSCQTSCEEGATSSTSVCHIVTVSTSPHEADDSIPLDEQVTMSSSVTFGDCMHGVWETGSGRNG